MAITIKSKQDIEKMRAAGRVVHKVLQHCKEVCKPGITTRQIDEEAAAIFAREKVKGLFLNYPSATPNVRPFPSNLCISINEIVVHGIADSRVIKDGDIVGLDCGVSLNGWCADSAYTVLVGNVAPEVRRLCEVTQEVLEVAVKNIRPGRQWSLIARLMQAKAEDAGYGVVREFVGHGIGKTLHEPPTVPNFVSRELLKNDIMLKEGIVLAVEPMCNMGGKEVVTLADGWTVKTADGKPSAHYEHTIAVTANGADLLTDGR